MRTSRVTEVESCDKIQIAQTPWRMTGYWSLSLEKWCMWVYWYLHSGYNRPVWKVKSTADRPWWLSMLREVILIHFPVTVTAEEEMQQVREKLSYFTSLILSFLSKEGVTKLSWLAKGEAGVTVRHDGSIKQIHQSTRSHTPNSSVLILLLHFTRNSKQPGSIQSTPFFS